MDFEKGRILWLEAEKTDQNEVTTSDIFGLHNTCFQGSFRCPRVDSTEDQGAVPGSTSLAQEHQEKKVVSHWGVGMDGSTHPYFRFRNPFFGPLHVTLREIGTVTAGGQKPIDNSIGFLGGRTMGRLVVDKHEFPATYWDQWFMVGRLNTLEAEKATN